MTSETTLLSKLNILVSLNGLSFYSKTSGTDALEVLKSISFSSSQRAEKIEDLLMDVFSKNYELVQKYESVLVIHSNNLSTFVPNDLFDEDYLGSYLQYNTKVFETDFFAFDALSKYQLNAVYIPYVNINNFFIDYYGSFNYQHSSSILVSKLLEISSSDNQKTMYVHISETHFEIVVVQNQQLILYNSFDYKTPDDFVYYILFTAEQLQLNPENFQLQLLGAINDNDALHQICFKYIRNVSFLQTDNSSNNCSETRSEEHTSELQVTP